MDHETLIHSCEVGLYWSELADEPQLLLEGISEVSKTIKQWILKMWDAICEFFTGLFSPNYEKFFDNAKNHKTNPTIEVKDPNHLLAALERAYRVYRDIQEDKSKDDIIDQLKFLHKDLEFKDDFRTISLPMSRVVDGYKNIYSHLQLYFGKVNKKLRIFTDNEELLKIAQRAIAMIGIVSGYLKSAMIAIKEAIQPKREPVFGSSSPDGYWG